MAAWYEKAEPIHERESDGIRVSLFWNPDCLEDEFVIRAVDMRTGDDFTIHTDTGKDAMHAFRHPFVAVHRGLTAGKVAA